MSKDNLSMVFAPSFLHCPYLDYNQALFAAEKEKAFVAYLYDQVPPSQFQFKSTGSSLSSSSSNNQLPSKSLTIQVTDNNNNNSPLASSLSTSPPSVSPIDSSLSPRGEASPKVAPAFGEFRKANPSSTRAPLMGTMRRNQVELPPVPQPPASTWLSAQTSQQNQENSSS
jgi:hypothetical protein